MGLRSVYEPVPENAITASAVYFVSDDQLSDLNRLADNPYRTEDSKNIVWEVQTECEHAGRVQYPVYVESDARDEGVDFSTMIDWIRDFIEEELSCDPDEGSYWYSGSRSIHAHLPKFLSHDHLEGMRERAEDFCANSDIDLDTGIYKRKQQFRIPGASHRKSNGEFQKVRIKTAWDHDRIIRTAGEDHPRPDCFLDVLATTFSPREDADEFALTLDFFEEQEIETPLIEQVEYPEHSYQVPKWAMYNSKEFSPYAHAHGNPRSVAVVEVKGGAFAREERRSGAPMIPVRFFGAIGCNGSFTKETQHAPLQLSEGKGKDYEKWEQRGYQAGDYVVIIGGQSRSSIIHSLEKTEALRAGFDLVREDGGRKAALTYLSDQGYDVGAPGSSSTTTSSGESRNSEARRIYPARNPPQTDAEELQRKAEQGDINDLTYPEVADIAFRHLRQGWDPTWKWFKEQFGSNFDPEKTWKNLRSIVEGNYEEYDHIEVPEKPV